MCTAPGKLMFGTQGANKYSTCSESVTAASYLCILCRLGFSAVDSSSLWELGIGYRFPLILLFISLELVDPTLISNRHYHTCRLQVKSQLAWATSAKKEASRPYPYTHLSPHPALRLSTGTPKGPRMDTIHPDPNHHLLLRISPFCPPQTQTRDCDPRQMRRHIFRTVRLCGDIRRRARRHLLRQPYLLRL
jgi:hypothetical protein